MKKQTGKIEIAYMAIAALLGWFALALQLYLIIIDAIENRLSLVSETIRYFSYYTILTNLMVAVCLTALLLKGGRGYFSRSFVLGGIAVHIAVVGITYSLLLRHIWNPEGAQLVVDRLLHDAMPVIYVLYWLIFVPKGNLKWSYSLSWLIYPAVYLAYVLIRGAVTGLYPYYFIDVTKLGYEKMLLNALFMLAGFILIGLLVIVLDRLLPKHNTAIQL